MTVYPDRTEEYEDRHNPIWPELAEVLHQHGVSNYSIFLDPQTNALFGYAEVASEAQWAAIATTDTCRKWWKYMEPLMETHPDGSPVSHDLREVFHLD